MKVQQITNASGRVIGSVHEQSDGRYFQDNKGRRVAREDGRYTYDAKGRWIGGGNQGIMTLNPKCK